LQVAIRRDRLLDDAQVFLGKQGHQPQCEVQNAALGFVVADVVSLTARALQQHGEEARRRVREVAEGASRASIALHHDVPARDDVGHEVGEHAPVVERHTRPVGVERPGHAGGDTVLSVPGDAHGLAHALAFAVAGAHVHWVHGAVVVLARRHLGVGDPAVDFAAAEKQKRLRALFARHFQQALRPRDVRRECADGV